jgi:HSP20 family protein
MRSLALINRRPQGDLFEDLWNEVERNLSNRAPVKRATAGTFTPALDIEEKDGIYLITIDLPGIRKEDIKIDLQDSVLTISGERVRVEKGEGRYTERKHGKFQRSFTLPNQIDAEKIEAKFEDGVLHMSLPQTQGAKSHTIKIQ